MPAGRAGSIAAHPTLARIYVADTASDVVRVVSYSSSGALSVDQTVPTAAFLRGIALSPDGAFLVTTHIFFPQQVAVYAVDAAGALAPAPVDTEVPAGATRAGDVLVTLSVGALSFNPTFVDAFPITASGLGVPVSLSVPDVAQHMAASSDGATIFTSSRIDNHVRSFSLDPTTLVLTENAGSPFPVPSPGALDETSNLIVSD